VRGHLRQEVTPSRLRSRLGHANPAVTLSVYAHFVPQANQAAAAALPGLLDD
jgi:hypothetical protein